MFKTTAFYERYDSAHADPSEFSVRRAGEPGGICRELFDNGISHEYRLVRGADHVGATLPERFRDALAFLGKALAPPAPPDPALVALHERVEKMKQAAGVSCDLSGETGHRRITDARLGVSVG